MAAPPHAFFAGLFAGSWRIRVFERYTQSGPEELAPGGAGVPKGIGCKDVYDEAMYRWSMGQDVSLAFLFF